MMEDIEIDSLLARFFAGEATPEEAMYVEDWKADSAVNRKYFDECLRIYPSISFDETFMEEKGRKRLQAKPVVTSPRRINSWLLGTAASIIIFIAIRSLLPPVHTNLPHAISYQAQQKSLTIALGDGSSVRLDNNSTLKLDRGFGKSNRNVTLKGSAFFSIKHHAVLPMFVHLDDLQIKDIGTAFSVTTKADTIRIAVREGEIFIFNNFGAQQKLIAGQKASYVRRSHQFVIDASIKTFLRKPQSAPLSSVSRPHPDSGKEIIAQTDTANGKILLECAKCSGSGKLVLRSVSNRQRVEKQITFEKTLQGQLYRYREELPPGEYLWVYIDKNKMIDHGKVTIKGSEARIRLFDAAVIPSP